MKGRFIMKTKMIKKLIASTVAVASMCSCLAFNAFAKTTDGTITIVDPGKHENTLASLHGEKINTSDLVTWIWEGTKSGDCYYDVKSDPVGAGNPITSYPVLKANLGENFWTEENKDKYIVITVQLFPQGGFDYYSLEGQNNYQLTAPALAVDWQMAGFEYNRFNRTYIVYKPSETRVEGDVTYFPNFTVYQNGVKNEISNNVWFDPAYQYPTEIGLRLSGWNPDAAQALYMNRFGVYVTDDPESIINDYDLISDQTGYANAWVPEGGTKATETGYLGKASDDISTHTAIAYGGDEYTNEVRQTLQMHNQDDNGDGTADWYTGNADKRYLVFGAQMASNQFTYVGLRADNEWFTPALAMWDYCLTDQWNQIYVVYDRYSEEGAGGARGKTYFYVNGVKVMDGLQRGGAWDKLAKRMDKISLYASNFHSGNSTDVHWDNVEMYTTDTLPDLTETMPTLSATDICTIEGWNVSLNGEVTPADLAFDGDKVRVYKGGDVNAPLADDKPISAWDTISVDKGNQVRKYTVVHVDAPAPKLLTNVMAYSPKAGNSAILSWVNPEYVIENTKVYLDGAEQAVEVDTAANAFNEILFEGLEADKEYSFKVTTTIAGEDKEYTTKVKVTGARENGVMGIDTLKSGAWMTLAVDNGGEYANTVFEIVNNEERGNFVKMTGNMPVAKPNVYAGIGQTIALDNDSDYVIKFKAMGAGANKLKLMISPDTENYYKFSNSNAFAITDEWAEYECVISPENIGEGTQSQVNLILYNEDNFTGTVFIDDVEVYYYDSEEGAIEDLGNQAVQGDFEPIPSVISDPVYSVADGMVNVAVDVQNVEELEVLLVIYKDGDLYKVSSLAKNNIIKDKYEIGASYEGDWAENKYSAKVLYWKNIKSVDSLRDAFVITQ